LAQGLLPAAVEDEKEEEGMRMMKTTGNVDRGPALRLRLALASRTGGRDEALTSWTEETQGAALQQRTVRLLALPGAFWTLSRRRRRRRKRWKRRCQEKKGFKGGSPGGKAT
jgi:hypothetical protein